MARPPGPILLPMIHPAYLFRSPTYAFAALEDWKKAVRIQREGPSIIPPPYEEWQWKPSFEQAMERLHTTDKGPWINDWEATLDGRPVCGSIGHLWDDDIPILNIPVLCQGGTRYWTPSQEKEIIEAWRRFMENPAIEKGNHNAVGYDFGYGKWNQLSLLKRAWNINAVGVVMDTMVDHATLWNELRHSLSFCASISTDLGPYKTEVHERPKDDDAIFEVEDEAATPWTRILEIPDQQLRCYCNDDVFTTKIVGRGNLKEMGL